MLERLTHRAGTMRLRDAIAVIEHDAHATPIQGFEQPLALMQEALALLDRGGYRLSEAAMHLQSAVDSAQTHQRH